VTAGERGAARQRVLRELRRVPRGAHVADMLADATMRSRTWRRAAQGMHLLPPDALAAHWFDTEPNLGDQLSPFLLGAVTGATPVWVSRRYPGKVLGAGSIANRLAPGDRVWGAGSIDGRPIVPPDDVTFLAVRGPLTRDAVQADVPAVYGDPALLLPQFFSPPQEKRFSVGIVPHFFDKQLVGSDDPRVAVIDVQAPWPDVVRRICACDVVVSSSLHGLIVAEAYGIPASWIVVSENVIGRGFKFHDYYLGTGREQRTATPWTGDVGAATSRPAPPPQFDPASLLAAAGTLLPSTGVRGGR
jgi:pyruvyltransferase